MLLQVEVLYEDEPLKEYYTLMDIAYIYPWRRVSRWCRGRSVEPEIRVVGGNGLHIDRRQQMQALSKYNFMAAITICSDFGAPPK